MTEEKTVQRCSDEDYREAAYLIWKQNHDRYQGELAKPETLETLKENSYNVWCSNLDRYEDEYYTPNFFKIRLRKIRLWFSKFWKVKPDA